MISERFSWRQLTLTVVVILTLISCASPATSLEPTLSPSPTTTQKPTPDATPTSLAGVDDIIVQGATDCALHITFVDNAGLMIESGGQKVLVDVLYDSLHLRDEAGLLIGAQPPFSDVDLILTTHEHDDHFSAAMVGAYLLASPSTQFVSTAGTVERLQQEFARYDEVADRVTAIALPSGGSQQETYSGIDVRMIDLPHGGPEPRNMGFIITIGDCTVFHTGDIVDPTLEQFQGYELPTYHIDVALVPYMYLDSMRYQPVIQEGIAAAYYVPIHHNPSRLAADDIELTRIQRYFPDAILFTHNFQRLIVLPAS